MPTFNTIVQPQGSQQNVAQLTKVLAGADPEIAAYLQAAQSAIGLLPDGGLKKYLTNSLNDPLYNLKLLWSAIKGKKYTTGQYKLGERFIKQITGNFDLGSYRDVPDDAVEAAMNFFTVFFGVRITTGEDLDALDGGIDAYYARGEKDDIPRAAVQRAVFLKQNYYPIGSYNQYQWNPGYFEQYPLVAPIPGLQSGTLYNGKIPGGAIVVNGVIPVNADSIMKQVIGAHYDANGDLISATGVNLSQQSLLSGLPGAAMLQKYAPIIALLLVIGLIISIRFKLFKP